MTYKSYLASAEWKEKAKNRRLIDGKCAICGSPLNLNVHHLTYKTFPNEKPSDLVTLCRFHHEEIERRKRHPGYDSFWIFNDMLVEQFIAEYEQNDYAFGGNKDYCTLEVIKRDLFPFLKSHGADVNHLSGSGTVQRYFRNKRYKVILDFIDHGYPIEITKTRVRFSYSMIKKVYDDADLAKRLIKEGDKNNENSICGNRS